MSLRGFTKDGSKRAVLKAPAAGRSPYTNPILLVDQDVELGRGLRLQLTRYGFCADLAITVASARTCVGYRYYHAMVVIADPSNPQTLSELRELRDAAPQTWMVVLASKRADTATQAVLDFGGDACLQKPFRFSELLFRLASLAHQERTG